MSRQRADLLTLQTAWQSSWEAALALWSRYTRLSAPRLCLTDQDAAREGLTESFAMIRLSDQAVVVNLHLVKKLQLESFALHVLGHEIGHHVYTPADLTDHARMIARIRRGLPGREELADLVGNLYTDLLINDRLQRSAGLSMAVIYEKLRQTGGDGPLWTFYQRIYEIWWSLPKGSLAVGAISKETEGDAYLGARLIRSYARQWLDGCGRFAMLCYPYLDEIKNKGLMVRLGAWRDTRDAAAGGMPVGLVEIEDDELDGAIHPALDPALSGMEADSTHKTPAELAGPTGSHSQYREPFEYGAILKALGLKLDDHEIAVRYYRERALPYLVRFPTHRLPETSEPLPEGLQTWEIGQPLEDADWASSVMFSPILIPGVTTVQRTWGQVEGGDPEKRPFDLDLYVDCSGSMPDPKVNVSYPTLAGAIVALSALRAGASVQATLWSGPNQFETTEGFTRSENAVLRILTGYLGGSTAFPIHMLRKTYLETSPSRPLRQAHILVISDEGVTTMFDKDELGNDGYQISERALKAAGGGGTMALNLMAAWEQYAKDILRAPAQGWEVAQVSTLEDLVAFARAFSARHYQK